MLIQVLDHCSQVVSLSILQGQAMLIKVVARYSQSVSVSIL